MKRQPLRRVIIFFACICWKLEMPTATEPTPLPSSSPTSLPTGSPTAGSLPSLAPTDMLNVPTIVPSTSANQVPIQDSQRPSHAPSLAPTDMLNAPTIVPSTSATQVPTYRPTTLPSSVPSNSPTHPTRQPSAYPSIVPTHPTATPTYLYHALSVHHGKHDEEPGKTDT